MFDIFIRIFGCVMICFIFCGGILIGSVIFFIGDEEGRFWYFDFRDIIHIEEEIKEMSVILDEEVV